MESIQTIEIVKDYKVLVVCLTYNHSIYIQDALNGFAMQQTDFPFACIVMDDASTDGEQETIMNWLNLECDMRKATSFDLNISHVIVVPHKKNQYCTLAIYLLKFNLHKSMEKKGELAEPWLKHAQYIALCEGDDYWTDPNKIQTQAHCLDSHPEIDLCTHGFSIKHAISGEIVNKKLYSFHNTTIPLKTLILEEGDLLATNSLFYRKSLELCIPDFRKFLFLDYTLCLHGALRGNIYYINQNMSVYRICVPNSITTLGENLEGHFSKLIQMLGILDKETYYQYHTYIETRELLASFLYFESRQYRIFEFLKKKQSYSFKSRILFLFFIFSHFSLYSSIRKKIIDYLDSIINSIK